MCIAKSIIFINWKSTRNVQYRNHPTFTFPIDNNYNPNKWIKNESNSIITNSFLWFLLHQIQKQHSVKQIGPKTIFSRKNLSYPLSPKGRFLPRIHNNYERLPFVNFFMSPYFLMVSKTNVIYIKTIFIEIIFSFILQVQKADFFRQF